MAMLGASLTELVVMARLGCLVSPIPAAGHCITVSRGWLRPTCLVTHLQWSRGITSLMARVTRPGRCSLVIMT